MNAIVKHEAAPETSAILSMVERAASDPNFNIENLERLIAMQERALVRQAEQDFNSAMNRAQSSIGRVATNKRNSQTSSDYADYAALDRVVRPVYVAEGFSLSFSTSRDAPEGFVRVLCYVSHSAGHTRMYEIDMPSDGKGAKGGDVMTKTHAVGSGTQYGQRYLLKLIFNIAIGKDDDGNGATIKKQITEEQEIVLRDLAEAAEADLPAFLKYMQAGSLGTIAAKDFHKAKAALEAKLKAKNHE